MIFMIEIRNLTKTFIDVKAVNDLSIQINDGINGLVGENGAGKSTLLRLIADVYQANEGEIYIDNLLNNDIEAKKQIFFLSDNPYAPNNYTIKQVFELYSSLFDLDASLFNRIMDKLNLPKDRKVSTYSKGMKRQFFIAIALSSNARYILLDEAFDGLDPLVLDVIKQEIISFADKKTFIVSSHNISSLERLCDNFIVLSKGRCAKDGDIEHIGENFVKYQILFKNSVTKEDVEKLGFSILSFKKVGSICNVVFHEEIDEDKLKEKYEMVLCEKIPIDPDELIALEMLSARNEGR